MNFYKRVKKCAGPLIKALFRMKVTGAENLPASGGLLLCANHTSMLDVLVLAAALDRQIRYMAKKELFTFPPLRALIKALGAYPVDRGGADLAAIKNTISLIQDGEMVGMFPQGTRYKYTDPASTKVKHGMGLVAWRAKCPVLPVYIHTEKNCVKWFRKTEIIIGKTISYEALGFENGKNSEYSAASEFVFSKICSLAPDKSSGNS